MTGKVRLCMEHELTEGIARGFHVANGLSRPCDLLVLRRGSEFYAYENRCPHRGTSLDWVEGRFMSADGQHLQCATHGALFRAHDGLCIQGPCVGDSLCKIELAREQGALSAVL
jgi:nitrite reductase/ring-hydroxylating ferredoxin subunit